MKRIKKTLCLMLVLALALGMIPAMTANTAVALDFEDADDIKNVEAASVNNALGIIVGDSVGFRPTDTLTRAEAATIITRMLLGADFAKIYEESTASSHFTDVSSSQWWSGVIMFTYERGIMYGTNASGTRFTPRGTLTIPEFAIMLMRALGKATTNDYRDGNWKADSVIDARRLGLLDGLSGDFTAPATRDIAAQMAFNALIYSDNPTTRTVTRYLIVQMNPDLLAASDGLGVISEDVRKELYTSFQAALTAANTDNADAEYGKNFTIVSVDAQQTVAADSLASEVHNLTSDIIDDPFGRPDGQRNWSRGGRVIYRAAVAKPSAGPYYGSVNESTVYTALGLNATATAATVIVDGYVTGTSQTIRRGNTSAIANSGRGVVTEFYRDGSDITIVIVNTYLGIVGTPTAATASTDRTIPISYYAGADTSAVSLTYTTNDFARNNVVLLTFARTSSAYNAAAIHSVELAPQRGDIRLERFVANTSVTFEGETRNYAAKAVYGGDTGMIRTGFNFNASYDFFLDKHDNIIGARPVSSTPITALNFVYINKALATEATGTSIFGTTAARLQVDTYLMDGSRKTYDLQVRIASATDASAAATAKAAGNMVGADLDAGDPFVRIGDIFFNLSYSGGATNKAAIESRLDFDVFSFSMDEELGDSFIVLSDKVETDVAPTTKATIITAQLSLTAGSNTITGITGAAANNTTRLVYIDPADSTKNATIVGVSSFTTQGPFGASDGKKVAVTRGNVITHVLIVSGDVMTGPGTPPPTSLAVYTGAAPVQYPGGITLYELFVDGEINQYRLASNSVSASTLTALGSAGQVFGFAPGAEADRVALSTISGAFADTAVGAQQLTAAVDIQPDPDNENKILSTFLSFSGSFSPVFADNVIIYNIAGGDWEQRYAINNESWVVYQTNANGRVSHIFIVPTPLTVTAGTVTQGAAQGTYTFTIAKTRAYAGQTIVGTLTWTASDIAGTADTLTPSETPAPAPPATAPTFTPSPVLFPVMDFSDAGAADKVNTFTFTMPARDITITIAGAKAA